MNEKQDLNEAARKFVDDVLEINRKYGAEIAMSDEDYKRAVSEAARPFRVFFGSKSKREHQTA